MGTLFTLEWDTIFEINPKVEQKKLSTGTILTLWVNGTLP